MAKQTSEKITLKAEPRTVTGKKVKQLRKQGLIPANIFGPNFKSAAITLPVKDFTHAYKIARETGIVYIELGKESIPTLVKMVQLHPLTDTIVHVDFRKIDLTQKIETTVPVQVTGQSEAVSQKGGVLLTQSDRLTVEALPQDIPQHIEVDITSLKDIGQEIKVKDLTATGKYTVKDDPEKVIVSVVAHKEESLEAETAAAAAPEVITAKPEGEAEGEGAAEAGTKETAPEKKQEK